MDIPISSKFVFHKQHLLVLPNPTNRPSSFLRPPVTKWTLMNPPKQILCSITVSNSNSDSTNYGGWEDLELDHHHSSKLHQFHNFLVSIGVDDTKHVFMLILGFISALAMSRVRVSSILVFPATVFVFSIGFSLGFLRRRGLAITTDVTSILVDRKAPKNDVFTITSENLNTLVGLFQELNLKVTNLEKDLTGAQQTGEIRRYYGAIKSVSSDIVEAKNIVEASINDTPTFVESKGETTVDDGRNLGHKSSRRRREPITSYFNVFHLFGYLFQENASVSKTNKVKDVTRREVVRPLNSKVVNNQNHNNVLVEATEQVKTTNSELRNKVANDVINLSPPEASRSRAHKPEVSTDGAKYKQVTQTQLNGNSVSMVNDTLPLSSINEFSQENYISQLVNNGNSMKARRHDGKEMLMPQDNLYDPLGPNVNRKSSTPSMDFKASLLQEENLGVSNGYYVPSDRRKKGKDQTSTFDFIEKREKSSDRPNLVNQQIACDSEDDSASLPSSAVSEDLIFNRNLTEATDLLKEARGYFKGKVDEDRAEVMLYKCAKLLSRATVLRPMSLLAVGQLGNTFLLHGELKLRISRELRTLLLGNDYFARRKTHVSLKVLDEQDMDRDRIASILVDVCEECEGLLVEAGRQYRMALSIDGSDVRALYNWGLALSYRAQLLADVGPEAASDADRVYLAAIDKFNEMMSRNKAYAPDALFRWGVALQQRSRLRPSNAKEKMKLLQQAKSLFEDALCMDSNNDQVRGALSSCISELNHRHF